MASIRERNGKFNVIYSYTNEKGVSEQRCIRYGRCQNGGIRKRRNFITEIGSVDNSVSYNGNIVTMVCVYTP